MEEKCDRLLGPNGFAEKLDAGSTGCAGRVCDVVTDKDTSSEAKAECDRLWRPSGFEEKLDVGSTDCAVRAGDAAADKDAC